MSSDSFPRQKEFAREGEVVNEEEAEALKRPEDEIPDLPENQAARTFLKSAPSKGLWMPLGREVKVMQCFRCKAFGHRTGDRECPLAVSGNTVLDAERQAREDPVLGSVVDRKRTREEKYERVRQLMQLVEEIRVEERERCARKKAREEERRRERKHDRKSRKQSKKSKKKSRKKHRGDDSGSGKDESTEKERGDSKSKARKRSRSR